MDVYSVIADLNEIRWTFDHLLEPLTQGETYCIMMSARHKKLNEAEKEEYQLGRSEMMKTQIIRTNKAGYLSFEKFMEKLYSFECNKLGMITKAGKPYPEKCLVSYIYLNPSSAYRVADEIMQYTQTIYRELIQSTLKSSSDGVKDNLYKISRVYEQFASCQVNNPSRKIFLDFDLDFDYSTLEDGHYQELIKAIHQLSKEFFGLKNFFMISTSGGLHLAVKYQKVEFSKEKNPITFCHSIKQLISSFNISSKEIILNKNCMVPIPGTFQFGRPVVILNKEDFINGRKKILFSNLSIGGKVKR